MDPLLRVENLAKHFLLHEQGREIYAARDVSFQLSPGELLAITGPSGVGKSSILKCIFRTYLASSGQIHFQCASGTWIDLADATDHDVVRIRQQEVNFVTQFLRFLPRKTTLEVVGQPLLDGGASPDEARERAARQLKAFGLPEERWEISPATFSGGERQRVNLARGFINRPRLLLLDEPTASLDPEMADRACRNIEQAKADGIAILGIFHDPQLIARLADAELSLCPVS